MVFSLRRWLATALTGTFLVANGLSLIAAENTFEATHKQVRSITPEMNGHKARLHTFCLGPDNHLWMCCEPVGGTAEKSDVKGAILVYNDQGKLQKEIGLSFVPQAINFAPKGYLFVAGSGKVARVSAEGKVELEKDAPNIGNKEEMLADMKKAQEKQMEMVLSSYQRQLEEIEKQLAKLKETPADEDEDDKAKTRRERRIKLLEQQKEQFVSIKEQVQQSLGGENSEMGLSRLMRATGVTATKGDVFVSLPVAKGYGYTIYRMNHDLGDAKPVVEDVGGCCGQLDIQSDGENLIIAENTAFQVGFYDRDGKRLNGFGKRFKSDQEGFGSCCNPMNVRYVNGEILTAESSIGHIKRFSKDGEYLGFIGTASIAGGCKHVAIGFDTERDQHYMMNIDRSNVAVLIPKSKAPAETEEERIAREAKDEFGLKLVGTWEIEKPKKEATASGDAIAMDDYISQMFAHVEFALDGTMSSRALQTTEAQAAAQAEKVDQKWKALGKKNGKLEFVVVQDSVQGFCAIADFVSEKELKLSWYYGSSEAASPVSYKLITKDACGQKCEACEKKEAEGEKK